MPENEFSSTDPLQDKVKLSKGFKQIWNYFRSHENELCSIVDVQRHLHELHHPGEQKFLLGDTKATKMHILRFKLVLEKAKIGKSIYSLFGAQSFMLAQTINEGDWISLPYDDTDVPDSLHKDMDFIYQAQLEKENLLKPRFTPRELEVLECLKNSYIKHPGEFISAHEIAHWVLMEDNADNVLNIREILKEVDKEIENAPTIFIENKPWEGYRFSYK